MNCLYDERVNDIKRKESRQRLGSIANMLNNIHTCLCIATATA